MAISETDNTTRRVAIAGAGIIGGLLAAIVMGAYAMIAAATYQGTGFFTPMYHIASSIGWANAADAMQRSMQAAQGGSTFTFDAGPALAGMALHLAVGVAWGLVFVIAARLLTRPTAAWVPSGVVFGAAVLAVMSFVVLPITAAIFDSGKPIEDMPQMVGWGTFTVEHLVFGLVLGAVAWALLRTPKTVATGQDLREATVRGRVA